MGSLLDEFIWFLKALVSLAIKQYTMQFEREMNIECTLYHEMWFIPDCIKLASYSTMGSSLSTL